MDVGGWLHKVEREGNRLRVSAWLRHSLGANARTCRTDSNTTVPGLMAIAIAIAIAYSKSLVSSFTLTLWSNIKVSMSRGAYRTPRVLLPR